MNTIGTLIQQFNRPTRVLDFLVPLIGDKKDVKIADIGSGPISVIGNSLDGVNVQVFPSDIKDFGSFWLENKMVQFLPIEIQDMERLTYENNFFDIVTTTNALDHTMDAISAVKEMIRVTKIGGWIHIDCHLDQLSTGHKHRWNTKKDGRFISKYNTFDLKDFGFKIDFIDNGGLSRYNRIVALLQKHE